MSFTDPLYFFFFSTGLAVGFGHCIGMCGPIVVSISLSVTQRQTTFRQLWYNIGRIMTYGILGGLMGWSGSFVHVTRRIEGLQRGVLIFTGVLIVSMGAAMAGWLPVGKIFGEDAGLLRCLSKCFKKLSQTESPFGYFPLGLLLGLLPCGPVYTALLASARAGMEATDPFDGIVKGACLMFAFGFGTIPALILVAKLTDLRWLKSRSIVYKVGSILMMSVGIYFIFRGIIY